MTKVKFRVYVTRRCRVCKKIHQMPTHRYIDHYGEEDPATEIPIGHALVSNLLEKENARAESRDRKARKVGTGRMHTNQRQRPLYQYCLEVSG
ncbi:hypothetical protein LCGC14_0207940 [marine sediment metagenome]|uniref:Uncharacterized protein n=1 Tax=marine sediment metagenome TaxID=412755 RepID=A0A0F9XJR2_9ZZZZ